MKRSWFIVLLTLGVFILSLALVQAQERRVGRVGATDIAPSKAAQKPAGKQPPTGLGVQKGQAVKGAGATGAVGAVGRKSPSPANAAGKGASSGKGAAQEATHQKRK